MIIETVITTLDKNNEPHFAAVGVEIDGNNLHFYLYKGSRTLENIKERKTGIINIVDKAEYLIKAALRNEELPVNRIEDANLFYLKDSCRYYKFKMLDAVEMENKYKIEGQIIFEKTNRKFLGFNRANNLLLEAAVKASRIGIKTTKIEVNSFLDSNKRVIMKTGDKNTENLFNFLKKYINNLGGNQIDRN